MRTLDETGAGDPNLQEDEPTNLEPTGGTRLSGEDVDDDRDGESSAGGEYIGGLVPDPHGDHPDEERQRRGLEHGTYLTPASLLASAASSPNVAYRPDTKKKRRKTGAEAVSTEARGEQGKPRSNWATRNSAEERYFRPMRGARVMPGFGVVPHLVYTGIYIYIYIYILID